MRVLVTGGAGLVAGHLLRALPEGIEAHVTWRSAPPPAQVPAHRVALDVEAEVRAMFERVRPDVVIHTAYTAGHRADVVDATAHLAQGCARHAAQLVHLSSDAVFSGGSPPYLESDPLEPVTEYGRWKAEAERLVVAALPDACITRTSLVVSLDPPDQSTRWLLDAVAARRGPTLFRDEIRTPIRAADLAGAIWALVGLAPVERRGIWHLPGPEHLSRLELGRRLLQAAGLDPDGAVEGSVADHPTPRARDCSLISRRRAPGPTPGRVP